MATFRLQFDDGTAQEISTSRFPAAALVAMEDKFGGDITTKAVLYGSWWGRARTEEQAVSERGAFTDWLATVDIEILPDAPAGDAVPPPSEQPAAP